MLLVFNITRTYVDLRNAQQVLALRQGDLTRRERKLTLTRNLAEADAATRLDTTWSEAKVAALRTRIPGQTAAVTAYINELAVLTESMPGALPPDLMADLSAVELQPCRATAPIFVSPNAATMRP